MDGLVEAAKKHISSMLSQRLRGGGGGGGGSSGGGRKVTIPSNQ